MQQQQLEVVDSNPAVIKRYAPPNQRNRSSNRRKSSSSSSSSSSTDRTNNNNNNSAAATADPCIIRNHHHPPLLLPDLGLGDTTDNNNNNNIHYPNPRFVALQGCSASAASHLLTHRWAAAMHSFNNSKDSSEKPVMYSGGTSVWTQFRLPHQIMTPAASASSSVPQLDFLNELRRQMHSADTSFTT